MLPDPLAASSAPVARWASVGAATGVGGMMGPAGAAAAGALAAGAAGRGRGRLLLAAARGQRGGGGEHGQPGQAMRIGLHARGPGALRYLLTMASAAQ